MTPKELLKKEIKRFQTDNIKKVASDEIIKRCNEQIKTFNNPNIDKFHEGYINLPTIQQIKTSSKNNDIRISGIKKLSTTQNIKIEKALEKMIPWRKGPFTFFNTKIDSEWQSNKKWNRLKKHLPNITNKNILDIGCGNAYTMFKLLDYNPSKIIGLDPSQVAIYQYFCVQKYYKEKSIHFLPLGWDACEYIQNHFHLILCMGVFYHQQDPINMLKTIKKSLTKNGELILETLIINVKKEYILFPKSRYAKMRNIYYIPSITALENMIKKAGFKDIKILNINQTSIREQRSTKWTFQESLKDFIDPKNKNKTIEGYPSPKRIMIRCK